MPEEDPNRQPILQLMGEMYNRQARIGYYLLYFIKVGSVTTPIVWPMDTVSQGHFKSEITR